MREYIIAHDIGTSGNKATLFTSDGEMLKSCVESYSVNFFNANYAQQNPDDWWRAVCVSTKKIIENIDVSKVVGMSFSAQMQGCLVVDSAGNPLRPAIIWADHRATYEEEQLASQLGRERIYYITGHRVSPSYSLEKLMWIKNNEPDIYARTYKSLTAKDYIIYKMTGEYVTDYSDASGTNALDLRRMVWSDEIIDAAGIDSDILPRLAKSIDIVGYISKTASIECGLKEGTPIVCGGGDGPVSAVGATCINDDELYLTFGTSAWIGGTTSEVFATDDQMLFCYAHVIPDKYMPCGTMQAAGSSYSYIRNTFFEGMQYDELNKLAEMSPVGSKNLLFLPYLLGERTPRWNPKTSGSFLGIKPKHNKEDYVRSTLEGIALNMELILQEYKKKINIDKITLTGGGAKGAIVSRIMADVLNLEINLPLHLEEATSIGAALIAGVGIGMYDSFEEVKRFQSLRDRIIPISSNVEVYNRLKGIFDQAYYCLQPLYENL